MKRDFTTKGIQSLNESLSPDAIQEVSAKRLRIGDWDGNWDSRYTKKGQWYVINEGMGGPMDSSTVIGFVQAKDEITEQEFRDKLVSQYGSDIAKHSYKTFQAVTAGQRKTWIKEQKSKIQAINDTISKSGLKV